MKLSDYLNSEGALTAAALAEAIGVRHVAQVNQWRNPKSARRPSPAYCTAIVRATGGLVRHWDLRPDWYKVWPELIGSQDAPQVPETAEA